MVAARTRAVSASPARTSANGRSRRSGHPGARVSALMESPSNRPVASARAFFRGPAAESTLRVNPRVFARLQPSGGSPKERNRDDACHAGRPTPRVASACPRLTSRRRERARARTRRKAVASPGASFAPRVDVCCIHPAVPRHPHATEWYESFFSPLALEFWRAVVPPESTRDEVDLLERGARARRSGATAGSALRRGSPRAGARPARAPGDRDRSLAGRGGAREGGSEVHRLRGGVPGRGHAGAARGAVRRRLLPRKQHRVPLARRSEGLLAGHAPVAPAGSEVGGGHGNGGRVAAAAAGRGGPDVRGGRHPLHRPSAVRRGGGATGQEATLERGAEREAGPISYGVYTVAELRRLFNEAGWTWSGCTGRWTGGRSRSVTRGC